MAEGRAKSGVGVETGPARGVSSRKGDPKPGFIHLLNL